MNKQEHRTLGAYDAIDAVEKLHSTIASQAKQIAALTNAFYVLDAAVKEHDTADYEWGEENPWNMREWFGPEDRAIINHARTTLSQTGEQS